METYKAVKNHEGIYEVSNLGNVKSLKYGVERQVKPILGSSGYLFVNLYKDNKTKCRTIHQLVAESFLDHTPNGHVIVVNHIDFNKLNNKASNIELVANRDNSNKKHLSSSSKYTGVDLRSNGKYRVQIYLDGKQRYIGTFTEELDAKNAYDNALRKHNFDITLVSNMQVQGIDMNDYPDFCDAFIVGADYNGVEMTEEQVIELEEDYPDFCYESIIESMH